MKKNRRLSFSLLLLASILAMSIQGVAQTPKLTQTGFYWPTGTDYINSTYVKFLRCNTLRCNISKYPSGCCHLGDDIGPQGVKLGTPVYAVADGIYISANSREWGGENKKGGELLIKHWASDGSFFIAQYGHVINIKYEQEFKSGKPVKVKAGEQIAELSHCYQTTGKDLIHLHFSILPNYNGINPREYSKQQSNTCGTCTNAKTYGNVNPYVFITTKAPLSGDNHTEIPILQTVRLDDGTELGVFAASKDADNEVSLWYKGKNASQWTYVGKNYDKSTLSTNGKILSIGAMRMFKDRLYHAVVGADNKIYMRYYAYYAAINDWVWTPWINQDGVTDQSVTLQVFSQINRLYVVYKGKNSSKIWMHSTDGNTWDQSYYTAGTAGSALGTDMKTVGAITMEELNGKLYQAIRGEDNGLYVRTYDGTVWSDWRKTGNTLTDVTLKVYQGQLYRSYQGTNNSLVTEFTTDGVTWTARSACVGGTTNQQPMMKTFQGNFYQTYKGSSSGLVWVCDGITNEWKANENRWNWWFTYPQGDTTAFGAQFKTDSSITMEEFDGRLYQAARGTDKKIYVRIYNGINWSLWTLLDYTSTTLMSPMSLTAKSLDGVVTVTFPDSTEIAGGTVSIVRLDEEIAPSANVDFTRTEGVYEITATNASGEPVTQFSTPIQVIFNFASEVFDETLAPNLKINYYDETLKLWKELSTTVDMATQTITGITNHFTKFSVFVPTSIIEAVEDVDDPGEFDDTCDTGDPVPPTDPVPSVSPVPDTGSNVPEPATVVLVGIGLLGLLGLRRRNRNIRK